MTSKLKGLKITPKKRSKETNPPKIFETLTLRGTVENIWDPQSESASELGRTPAKKKTSSSRSSSEQSRAGHGAPGASVTIAGSGFGLTQSTGTVNFNGAAGTVAIVTRHERTGIAGKYHIRLLFAIAVYAP